MKKHQKHTAAPFRNIPFRLKFIILYLLTLLCVSFIGLAMAFSLRGVQQEKYTRTENIAIIAADQIMNMSIENTVSVAQNIYTNEAVYDFLNKRYASSSEYYEAFYPLQQNTALNIADIKIIDRCTIYTENPTVLTGGSIHKLDDQAKEEYWYQYYQKVNKATLLCIDPDTSQLLLVRNLNYLHLDTGESYLCIILDRSAITQYINHLEFDGELYVMSGSSLLYSSNTENTSVDDIGIDSNFQGMTRNYYTTEIETYACATHRNLKDMFRRNLFWLICLIAGLLLAGAFSISAGLGMTRRLRNAAKEFGTAGVKPTLKRGDNGRDEIGKLLDICCDMSERLQKTGNEFQISSDSLQQKSSAYDTLYATAMRLDAELSVAQRLPSLHTELTAESIPLADELDLLRQTAAIHGAAFSLNGIPPEDWKIGAYSLALAADDLFGGFGSTEVSVVILANGACLTFTGTHPLRTAELLRLRAIFEDGGIAEAYAFDRSYRYNPYLRLKHDFDEHIDAEIGDKNSFRFVLRLTF